MAYSHRYEAILENYKKQEAALAEHDEKLDRLIEKYYCTITNLAYVQNEWDKEQLQDIEIKLEFAKSLQKTMNRCQESNLTWKRLSEKQTEIEWFCKEVANVADGNIRVVQEGAKQLKTLKDELQLDHLSLKIKDYRSKTELAKENLDNRIQDLDKLPVFDPKQTAYQISELEKTFLTRLTQKENKSLGADIAKTKKNLKLIDAKIKELEKLL